MTGVAQRIIEVAILELRCNTCKAKPTEPCTPIVNVKEDALPTPWTHHNRRLNAASLLDSRDWPTSVQVGEPGPHSGAVPVRKGDVSVVVLGKRISASTASWCSIDEVTDLIDVLNRARQVARSQKPRPLRTPSPATVWDNLPGHPCGEPRVDPP